jgi:hypothetical protein
MGKINDIIRYLALKKANFELMEIMTEEEKTQYIDKLVREWNEKLQSQALQEVLQSKM